MGHSRLYKEQLIIYPSACIFTTLAILAIKYIYHGTLVLRKLKYSTKYFVTMLDISAFESRYNMVQYNTASYTPLR